MAAPLRDRGGPRPTIEALGIDRLGNPAIAVHTYAPRPTAGFHVRWSAAPKDRIVMVRCADRCRGHVWHDLDPDQQTWSYEMAFRPDGAPILMEGDDRLVWCERNCG